MSRRKPTLSPEQQTYIKQVKAQAAILEPEVKAFELKARHLKAMIETYTLQKQWDELEIKLREEQEDEAKTIIKPE